MISAIGIDSVEISRFTKWYAYSTKKLTRIFTSQELEYCLAVPAKSAERFAVRFAAKEAVFKALSQAYPDANLNFLSVARACEIIKVKNAPTLSLGWQALQLPPLHPLLSLTHTKEIASAFVILQQNI